ncbi:uncharacterized protein LOC144424286 [Styela clava]
MESMTATNGSIQSPNYPERFRSSNCRTWNLPHHKFSQNSSLVLFVRTMNMMFISKTTYLAGSLFVNGTNIATISNGTCLIFHGSNQKCRKLENIKMPQKCTQRFHNYEEIDSFTVKFKPSPNFYALMYPRKFQIDYEYLPCMEDAIHDDETTKSNTYTTTTINENTTFTTSNPTTSSRKSTADPFQEASVYRVIAIVLGILLLVVLIALFVLIVRYRRINRQLQEQLDSKNTAVTSTEADGGRDATNYILFRGPDLGCSLPTPDLYA